MTLTLVPQPERPRRACGVCIFWVGDGREEGCKDDPYADPGDAACDSFESYEEGNN